MLNNKKSIPTVYGNQTFRSKTEAKYAVAFDKIGIKYEYEPEGYEFDDGTKYLPDFYLPDYDVWFEVKGCLEEIDIDKIYHFERSIGSTVIIGDTDFNFYDIDKNVYYLSHDDGFNDEFESQDVTEAFQYAKTYKFDMPEVEKKEVVDDNALSRLFDLKATYLNDFYTVQSAYPRIKNQVADTINFKYQLTPYYIYITAGQREDFKIALYHYDDEIIHFSVKEDEVADICKKLFRTGFLMHEDDMHFRGRHHDEIVDQKLNEISSWLRTKRLKD